MVERITEISFIPHHHTLTKCSHHFKRISDGFAEFIDNSIQACNQIEDIRIHVSLHFSKEKDCETGFAVIFDNGCGMDETELKYFAIHSLNSESRSNLERKAGIPLSSLKPGDHAKTTHLSKFGVGAKQAGFFLGNRIRIISRKRNKFTAKELVIDEKLLDERFEQNGNNEMLYKGKIEERAVGNISCIMPLDEEKFPEMRQEFENHEKNNEQFTYIVIKLKEETIKRLRREKVSAELAEIYHFYLNPNHLPHKIYGEERFQLAAHDAALPSQRSDDFPLPKKLRGDDTMLFMNPVNISMSTTCNGALEGRGVVELKSIEASLIKQYIKQATSLYRVNLSFPDPLPSSQEERMSMGPTLKRMNKTLKEDIANAALPDTKYHNMGVMIFYYPFSEKETKPTHRLLAEIDEDIEASSDEDHQFCENDERMVDDSGVLSVFWQNRLVPNTMLQELPFFPKTTSKFSCDKLGLPENWKGRLKGFVFLDWNFNHISNNKLMIQVTPSFNSYLNKDVKEQIRYCPNSPNDTFKTWLLGCHKKFDRETRFEIRDTNGETERKLKPGISSLSLFQHLYVGKQEISINKTYLLSLPNKASRSSGAAGKRREVVATIRYLEVDEILPPDTTKFGGKGSLRFVREPSKIYGEDVSDPLPISCIVMKAGKCQEISQKAKQELSKQIPHGFSLLLVETPGAEPKDLDQDVAITVGFKYYKLLIQIQDGNGSVVTSPPQAPYADCRYTINLTYTDEEGSSKSFGEISDLWQYDVSAGLDNRAPATKDTPAAGLKQRKEANNVYFSVNDFILTSPGSANSLCIEVMYGRNRIYKKVVNVRVVCRTVHDIEIVGGLVQEDTPLIMGAGLSNLQIDFKDQFGNNVKVDSVGVQLTAPKFKILCDGNSEPCVFFNIDPNTEGCLYFESGQWVAEPLELERSFHEKIKIHKVQFTLKVFFANKNKDGDLSKGSQVGKTKHFTRTFHPGPPASIELAKSLPDRLVNGEQCPPIGLNCLDRFSNRTGPSADDPDWRFELDPSGPLSCDPDCEVSAAGQGKLTNVKLNFTDFIPADGLIVTQLVYLLLSADSQEKNLSKGRRKSKQQQDTEKLSLELKFQVVPSSIPTHLKILRSGCDVGRGFSGPVGSIISDLSFRIEDDNGNEVDIFGKDDGWLQDRKKTGLTVSWSKGRGTSPLKSTSLPDIQLDTVVLSDDYNITISLTGVAPLFAEFIITTTPSEPSKWHIVISEEFHNGILSGEVMDLRSKLLAVCLVDRFNNIVNFPTTQPSNERVGKRKREPRMPFPKLIFTFDTPNEMDEDATADSDLPPTKSPKRANHLMKNDVLQNNQFELLLQLDTVDLDQANPSATRKCFVLSETCNAISKYLSNEKNMISEETNQMSQQVSSIGGQSTQIWFHVCSVPDADNAIDIEPATQIATVVAGYPRFMNMSCASQGVVLKFPTEKQTYLQVHRFTKLSDLYFHFFDKDCNATSVLSPMIRKFEYEIVVNSLNGKAIDTEKEIVLAKGKSSNKSVTKGGYNILVNNMYFSVLDNHLKELCSLNGAATSNPRLELLAKATYTLANKTKALNTSTSSTAEIIVLEPLTVICEMQPLNVVTSILMKLVTSDGLMATAEGTEQLVLSVDDATSHSLPSLEIQLVTDDGVPFIQSLSRSADDTEFYRYCNSSLSVHITCRPVGSAPKEQSEPLEMQLLFQPMQLDYERNILKFAPLISAEPFTVGLYAIRVTYQESRDLLTALPDKVKKCESSIDFQIVAGEAFSLQLDQVSHDAIAKAVVSNGDRVDRPKGISRLIGTGIRVRPMDRYGNATVLPEGSFIGCDIAAADNQAIDSLPQLVGAMPINLPNQTNVLFGAREKDGSYLFQSIELQPSIGTGEGRLALVFCQFISDTNKCDLEIVPSSQISVCFTFTSNAFLAEEAEKLHQKLGPIQEIIKKHEKELKESNNELTALNKRIHSKLAQTMHGNLRCFEDDAGQMTQNNLIDGLDALTRQRSDMMLATQVRQPVRPPLQFADRLMGVPSVIGRMVDVAFVDDLQDAELVSWAMADHFMGLVITETLEDSRMLYERGIKSWAVGQVEPHNRPKMKQQIEQQKILDLPQFPPNTRGNPKYMVNMLQFEKKYEHLRSGLFYHTLYDCILFDDQDSAHSYREYLRSMRMKTPAFFTRDGHKIEARGILDPNPRNRKPARPNFVFGQLSTLLRDELVAVEKDIEVIGALKQMLVSRDEIQTKLNALNSNKLNIAGMKAVVKDLQEQIQKLGTYCAAESSGETDQASQPKDDGAGPETRIKKRRQSAKESGNWQ